MWSKKELWERAVSFHGHVCPGLMIGYRAALYAAELLTLRFSEDEEVVCIAENDSCSIDAIQAVLGCTMGKGNLILRIRGKQAFNFYNRETGRSIRIVQRNLGDMTREEKMTFLEEAKAEDIFEIKDVKWSCPEEARIYESYVCEKCGEKTGGAWVRIVDGKVMCMDCVEKGAVKCIVKN